VGANQEHRILLANFTTQQAEFVRKAGFNVELGYVGKPNVGQTAPSVPFHSPYPLFDYDIYVYNSVIPEPYASQPPQGWKSLQVATLVAQPPVLRIAFTSGSAGPSLLSAGLYFVQLKPAGENVSKLEAAPAETFAIPELHDVLSRLRGDVAIPIGSYIWVGALDWPLRHFAVITNRNKDQIAAYGVSASSAGSDPLYIVLPQLRNNVAGLVDILRVISTIRPGILPGVRTRDWLSRPEFKFAEETDIDHEIEQKLAETKTFIDKKRADQATIREHFGFIKEILVATEGPEVDPPKRLAANVRQALQFVGFEVDDIDAKIKGAIRKEDFWVKDGEFFAITEVTGTNNKNPKSKEYNDILGRLNTIFKRSDLVPEQDRSRISGLLVVNYDIDNHPSRRPRLYSGDLEHIVEAAKDSSIGLLSTVELHKVAMAVKRGELTKESARSILRQFGRIEYTPKKGSP